MADTDWLLKKGPIHSFYKQMLDGDQFNPASEEDINFGFISSIGFGIIGIIIGLKIAGIIPVVILGWLFWRVGVSIPQFIFGFFPIAVFVVSMWALFALAAAGLLLVGATIYFLWGAGKI